MNALTLAISVPKPTSVVFPLLGHSASDVVIVDEESNGGVLWDQGVFVSGVPGVRIAAIVHEQLELSDARKGQVEAAWKKADAINIELVSGIYQLVMQVGNGTAHAGAGGGGW
jgi:hypothetical protein